MDPLTRSRLKDIARLTRRRHREAGGEFLIEGVRSVESAVVAGAELREILVSPEATADQRVAGILEAAGCPIHTVPARDLARIGDAATSQGVLAVATIRRSEPADLRPPIVALDGVQDPGNVGAVIRTAAWFGVASVLVGPGTADPFGPKAVRASMGGLWEVAIGETGDLAASLRELRGAGVTLYGADVSGSSTSEWRPAHRSTLVIGSEAHGLSEAVRRAVDERVTITGRGGRGVESLNAAVATGILLHCWLGGRPA